jgi:hypothetical protein
MRARAMGQAPGDVFDRMVWVVPVWGRGWT